MIAYLFKQEDPRSTDFELIGEEGSIASFYWNGKGMIVDYYRERINPEWKTENFWNNLGEGKSYFQEWPGQHKLTKKMLKEVSDYMGFTDVTIKVITYTGYSPEAILTHFKNNKMHQVT